MQTNNGAVTHESNVQLNTMGSKDSNTTNGYSSIPSTVIRENLRDSPFIKENDNTTTHDEDAGTGLEHRQRTLGYSKTTADQFMGNEQTSTTDKSMGNEQTSLGYSSTTSDQFMGNEQTSLGYSSTTADQFMGNEQTSLGYSSSTTDRSMGNDTAEQYQDVDVKLSFESCFLKFMVPIFGKRGRIRGMFGDYLNSSTGPALCHWSIQIPDGFQYLYVLLTMPEDPCMYRYRIETIIWEEQGSQNISKKEARVMFCRQLYKQIFVKTRQYDFLLLDSNKHMALRAPTFILEFDSYTEDVRKRLQVTSLSPMSGYIRQWGYDGEKNHFCFNDAYHELKVPEGYTVMVSFPRFDLSTFSESTNDSLCLYSSVSDFGIKGTFRIVCYCGAKVIPAKLYDFSLVFHFRTETYCRYATSGFKALYSFLHILQKPKRQDHSLFNCSTANYGLFMQHLDCNFELECVDSEDESGHCPFSNFRCNGFVSAGHKCYQYVFWDYPISAYAAQRECARRHGDLAMVKSQSEWNHLKKLFQYGKRLKAAVFGVRTGDFSLPDMYRYMLKWVDSSVAQNVHVLTQSSLKVSYHYNFEMCGVLHYRQKFHVEFELCKNDIHLNFLCQIVVQPAPRTSVVFPVIPFPMSVANRTKQWLLMSTEGHVTHAFLSCELQSHAQRDQKFAEECKLPVDDDKERYFVISMFTCDEGEMSTPYTLVCDFREDCNDGSDEAFCVHDSCEGFLCRNRQCVTKKKRCNLERDCFDQSDEEGCEEEVGRLRIYDYISQVVRLPPPVTIDFNQTGHFTQVPLSASAACPETHFRCADDYCLPVYVRCNGVKDCAGEEDEGQCELFQCAGFYHCRSSAVCVHADHLCDGWPQCPQQDDEWFCNWTCPAGCLCQGYALQCFQPVSPASFPAVRYLDASGSGMKPQNITGLKYLVWLSLSKCGLNQMSEMVLPNLRSLDLSSNYLPSFHVNMFTMLPNLKTFDFSRNFLSHFPIVDPQLKHPQLYSLDLSWNTLNMFDMYQISVFPKLDSLNLSYSKVSELKRSQGSTLYSLRKLDFRGNQLLSYSQNVFASLDKLQYVWTDDYRLCCQQNLPQQFYTSGHCISSQMRMSSCEDLLRYKVHRVILLVVMLLCFVGNLSSLLVKCYMSRNSRLSPVDIQMIHWNMLDLLMGVYVAIIVMADWIYRHQYFSVRHVWTASFMCGVAGLLASVSYQATAFLVCCVTVHSLCIACPQHVKFQFTARSSLLVCSVVWILAIAISVVPFALPEWGGVHGHTDTCLAVLSTVSEGPGQLYALAMQIILHVTLGLLVCGGQSLLRWVSCFHDVLSVSITQRSVQMGEALSTSSQVLLDCVRRLVFCVISVLVHGDVPLPEHVHVAFAILVLPVSAALNPLLHVFGRVMARRRQRTLQRVLQRLQRQLVQKKSV